VILALAIWEDLTIASALVLLALLVVWLLALVHRGITIRVYLRDERSKEDKP
jgi:hypothetical protein